MKIGCSLASRGAKGLNSLELTGRQRSMMQRSGATRIDEVVFGKRKEKKEKME